jgi:hypothetical protein
VDLGSVSLPLRQLSFRGESELSRWFSLSSSGAIRLGLRWRYGAARLERGKTHEAGTIKAALRDLPPEMRAEAGGWGEEVAAADETTGGGGADRPAEGEYSVLVYVAEARDVQGRDANGMADCSLVVQGLGGEERTKCIPSTRNPVFDQTVFFSKKGIDEVYLTRNALCFRWGQSSRPAAPATPFVTMPPPQLHTRALHLESSVNFLFRRTYPWTPRPFPRSSL